MSKISYKWNVLNSENLTLKVSYRSTYKVIKKSHSYISKWSQRYTQVIMKALVYRIKMLCRVKMILETQQKQSVPILFYWWKGYESSYSELSIFCNIHALNFLWRISAEALYTGFNLYFSLWETMCNIHSPNNCLYHSLETFLHPLIQIR
jgi:hypothetical protein